MTNDHICEALVEAGTMTKAAAQFGVRRSTLFRWLRARGIYVIRDEAGLIIEADLYPEESP